MPSKSKKIYAPYGGGSRYYYTISISATELALKDENKEKNTSSVTVVGKIEANGGIAFSGSSVQKLLVYWYDDNKNPTGTLIASKNITELGLGAEVKLETTISVAHKADGTLKGYAKVEFTKSGTNSYIPASGSAKFDWFALTTIPRATAIGNFTGTIGEPLTISWTKASSSFTHKLTYEFEGTTGTIGEGLVDSIMWVPPESFYELIPNDPQKTGKLFLTTYSGETQIGDVKESVLTIKANEYNANVQIEEFNVRDENVKTRELTGDFTTLVLTKSEAFATLTFITNDKQYGFSEGTEDGNGNTSYGITTSLGTATTGTFKISITDTRDFTTKSQTRNDVVNYIPLTAKALFKRTAPTTGKIGLSFEGNYFGQSFGNADNEIEISYKYKKTSEDEYSEDTYFVEGTHFKTTSTNYYSGTGNSKQTLELTPIFNYKLAYNLVLTVRDKLTDYPPINVVVVKGIPIMWWNGEKVTINGDLYIADENGENAVNVGEKLNNLVVDNLDDNATGKAPSQRAVNKAISTIIESGSNVNGSYIKYSDGTMVVSQIVEGSIDISKAWGSLYVSEDIKLPNFPVSFIKNPTTVVSPQTQSGTQFMLVGSGGSGNGDKTFGGHYALVRPNSRTAVTYVLEVIAIGKWK